MAGTRAPGAPVRGVLERDVRQRLFSTLHELDDLDLSPPRPEVRAMATPTTSEQQQQGSAPEAATLAQIASIMKQEVQPLRNAISGVQRSVADLGKTFEARMGATEERLEDIDIRLTTLENTIPMAPEGSYSGSHATEEVMNHIKALEIEIAELRSAAGSIGSTGTTSKQETA
eukprot:5024310-Pyramimonas_sp.AAC.1